MKKQGLPTWNLTDLYMGLDDQQIQNDIETLTAKAKTIAKTYQGAIKEHISAADLAKILNRYAFIVEGTRKLGAFAYLVYATNKGSARHGALFQHISTQITTIVSHILFIDVALAALSPETLLSLAKDPLLEEDYGHFLEKQQSAKPHRLSEEAESVLYTKSLTSNQAFARFYEDLSTKQQYPLGSQKKKATLADLFTLFHSPKRSDRKTAAKTRYDVHKNDPVHATFLYNTLVQDWDMEAEMRHFALPEDVKHLDNEIDRAAVDALVQTVVDHYPLVHEYYRFKKQLLGLKSLHDYDKYAPIAQSHVHYSFAQAKDIILNAFTSFSPEFAKNAQEFFDNQWIDASLSTSKQSGAFCYYVTPKNHPYILVNYTGTLNEVSTLAHELGHGVHASLARQQSILHFDWPQTTAETASVFAEMVVFKALKETLTSPQEKLSLYCAKIESIFATIPRQIAMFRFERQVHHVRTTQGELTTEQLNALWRKEQQAMFGKSLTLSDYEDTYWQIIPHIFRSPFYVYAYAFGELLTLSLFAQYEKHPEGFASKYLDLLRAGGSASPQELLQPFGIDLRDPLFWKGGMEEIRKLITEAKRLARQI